MTSDDYDQFVSILQTLAAVFRGGMSLTDPEVRFYWDALKDRPLADVARRAEKYGVRGRYYPKPRDLRPTQSEEAPTEETDESRKRFERLNAESIEIWNERLREDPLGTKLALCDALAARYSVEKDQGSLILAEKREWLQGRRAQLLWQLNKGKAA